MDDQWFTDNVFEVVVPKSALPEDLAAAVDSEPLRFAGMGSHGNPGLSDVKET